MAVTVRCPNCRRTYHVRKEDVGGRARCKKCGSTFTLTAMAEETAGLKARPRAGPSATVDGSKSTQSDGDESERLLAQRPAGSAVPPKTIGPYVILRRLAEGGMGEVWLAHDPNLDRDVAIKTLPARFAADGKRLKRFLREARLAAKLHHTNTITVYQVGQEGNLVFIAMECIDGQSLNHAVSPGRLMPWREATRAIRDAAAGLEAAHRLGLVHRDIKPANLMQTRDGVTKVADFGLACSQFAESRMTQDGSILGTPAYMSPEQWDGGQVDARSDLYSLACTYYYLLTGRDPFVDPTSAGLGYMHCHVPVPDPRQFCPRLPDAVCHILAQCLKKKPEERYASAGDLLAELDALLTSTEETLTFGAPWEQAKASGRVGRTAVQSDTSQRFSQLRRFAARGLEAMFAAVGRGHIRKKWLMSASLTAGAAVLLGIVLWIWINAGKVEIGIGSRHVITNSIGMKLVLVPAGEFTKVELPSGPLPKAPLPAPRPPPPQRVRISKAFYLGTCEVTQEQYEKIMGVNPSYYIGDSRRPVDSVSWNDAVEFCRRLSTQEGVSYRLPTEAEWEYACRAGTTTTWCFGDSDSEVGEYAWHRGNANDTTHPVGQKKRNAWGLYDMYGHVEEWCADAADGPSPKTEPGSSALGASRVSRGGSFWSLPPNIGVFNRGASFPDLTSANLGFRVARTCDEAR